MAMAVRRAIDMQLHNRTSLSQAHPCDTTQGCTRCCLEGCTHNMAAPCGWCEDKKQQQVL